jgi:hypothetical protein
MKDWDKGRISQLVSMYVTTLIRKTKFICALKKVAHQYVKIEAKNVASSDNESSENKKAFLGRIKSTIK